MCHVLGGGGLARRNRSSEEWIVFSNKMMREFEKENMKSEMMQGVCVLHVIFLPKPLNLRLHTPHCIR